ncbi:MAG: hypothetical protein Q8M39_02820 [Sulfuricurvum sp.]|nr:hypothetical protein [Sulfuricurvum sp.]
MKRTIFYSWQSDLPNNTNRNVIEDSIKKALENFQDSFKLELSFDKDTNGIIGTPEIVDTIFQKIRKSTIFIADISIINKDSSDRKTSNPNVLFELGFAFSSLGSEKIICIYNTDYGKIEDLPFDLRQKRILTYSLNENSKKNEIIKLSKTIQWTVEQLYQKGLMDNEVQDYFKVQIDTKILRLLSHIAKILFGYTGYKTLESINDLFNLESHEIKKLVEENTYIGFQIFKRYLKIEDEIRELVDKALSSSHYDKDVISPLIKIIRWIGSFEKLNSVRTSPSLFIATNKKNKTCKVVYGPDMNPNNDKNGYLLLESIDKIQGRVIDFGDFIEKMKIEKQLYYFKLNPYYYDEYSENILQLFKYIEEWLDITNGEFIIDTNKEFEIRRVKEI